MLTTTSKQHNDNIIITIVTSSIAFVLGVALAQFGLQTYNNNDDNINIKDENVDHDKSILNKQHSCIYLDYNGTTPIYNEIYNGMILYLTKEYGNPSSSHAYGIIPKQAIDNARKQILNMLGVEYNNDTSSSIIFTGCGTESNNLAIHIAIQIYHLQNKQKQQTDDGINNMIPHIVTSNVEHPAILACLKVYEKNGLCEVTYIKVQNDGRVLALDVINAIRINQTTLVTLMLANNEVGSINPMKDISNYCHTNNILIHIDAAQAVGKVNMKMGTDDDSIIGMHCDMMTIVGHKIGAPKGIACLYIQSNIMKQYILNNKIDGALLGGGQEFGLRAGTENVPYIVALGKACEICNEQWKNNNTHMEYMRQLLLLDLQTLLDHDASLLVHGPKNSAHRLPNTLSIGIKGINSNILLNNIGKHVAASAGAACHSSSDSPRISNVLLAMNIEEEYGRGTIRLSVGNYTTSEEIHQAATIIADEVKKQLHSPIN